MRLRFLTPVLLSVLFAQQTAPAQYWKKLSGTLDAPIQTLAISSKTNTLFAGTDSKGVYRSTNDGVSWQQLTTNIPTLDVRNIVVDHDGAVYAVIFEKGLFRSTDDGNSWSQLREKTTAYSVAVAPDGTIYYSDTTVWASTDAGAHWTTATNMANRRASAITVDSNGNAYVSPLFEPTIYKTTDRGATWATAGVPNSDAINPTALAAAKGGAILTSNENGVFYTTNGGANWGKSSVGVSEVRSILITSTGEAFVPELGAYASKNYDAGWQHLVTGWNEPDDITGTGMTVSTAGYAYLASSAGALYKSAQPVVVQEQEGVAPVTAFWSQIGPNPSHGNATLSLSLERAALVTVRLTDLLGRDIWTSGPRVLASGSASLELSSALRALNSGTYIVQVSSNGTSALHRLVLQR